MHPTQTTPPAPPTGLTGTVADHGARAGLDDLAPLVAFAADRCGLGPVGEWRVITTGFEDCNIAADTRSGPVVVKAFARGRGSIAARTTGILHRAIAHGVHHPALRADAHGRTLLRYRGTSIIVMDRAPGADYYTLRRPPTRDELARIVGQAALLHTVDARPTHVHDPWALTNLVPLAERMQPHLDAEQRVLVAAAIHAGADIDRGALPHALIHGDLTKGNVLTAPDGWITVLDFAVAHWAPRIQDLAVIAANLTHSNPRPLPERVTAIADLYADTAGLTDAERVALDAYAHAAAAMEFLGALAEQRLHGATTDETDYLISLGLAGLRDTAETT
ncbi:phosphotransferase [Streptodolium elevatio]